MFGQNISPPAEAFSLFSDVFTTFAAPFLVVGIIVSIVLALFGYKMFKIAAVVFNAVLGLGLGAAAGAIINGIIAFVMKNVNGGVEVAMPKFLIVIPIIGAIVCCISLILKSLDNPFVVIEGLLGTVTFVACALTAYLLMTANTGTPPTMGVGFIIFCLVIPFIIAAIVCAVFTFIASGVIIIGSSYGGALSAVFCLFNIIGVDINVIVPIIIGIVLGTLCVFFQIKTTIGKCTPKEFLLHGQQFKKRKKADKDSSELAAAVAAAKAEAEAK